MWTDEEIKIVLNAIATGLKPCDILEYLPGRNLNAVSVKMSRLRSGTKQKGWTSVEKELLFKNYEKASMEELLEMLPGRTAGSIRGQISRLRKQGWGI